MEIELSRPDQLPAWYSEVYAPGMAELMPGLPVPSYAETRTRLLSDRNAERRLWLATEGPAVLGSALLLLPQLDNTHAAELEILVAPPARRRGVGRALARQAAAAAAGEGRRLLHSEAPVGSPALDFAASFGSRTALAASRRDLRLDEVPSGLADRLRAEAAAHAVGYSLLRWVDRCPDELVDGYARAKEAMNTAPIGDLDMEDLRWDAGRVRTTEERRVRSRVRAHHLVARHDATGEIVGLTEVLVPSDRPALGLQEDTAVVPPHRGHRLGLLLKAEMLRWLAVEQPQLALLTTWNADSNAPMIRVNDALGFRVVQRWFELETDVDRVLRDVVATLS